MGWDGIKRKIGWGHQQEIGLLQYTNELWAAIFLSELENYGIVTVSLSARKAILQANLYHSNSSSPSSSSLFDIFISTPVTPTLFDY